MPSSPTARRLDRICVYISSITLFEDYWTTAEDLWIMPPSHLATSITNVMLVRTCCWDASRNRTLVFASLPHKHIQPWTKPCFYRRGLSNESCVRILRWIFCSLARRAMTTWLILTVLSDVTRYSRGWSCLQSLQTYLRLIMSNRLTATIELYQ